MPHDTDLPDPDDGPMNAAELIASIRNRLSRRGFLVGSGALLGGGALLSSGGALAQEEDAPADRFSGGNEDVPGTDVDVLNYALTLEHLEDVFYRRGTETFDASDFEMSEALAGYSAEGPNSVYENVQLIGEHESTHTQVLTGIIEALGGEPAPELEYEFGFETVGEFLAIAQALENTGVSAYNGALSLIESPDFQTAAATIATVEARHAAYLNDLNGDLPFPDAFDDARSMQEVLDIAQPFIDGETGTRFTVRIENVSTETTLQTGAEGEDGEQPVPLSPGAYAVHGLDAVPMFSEGEPAFDNGLEAVAEDGDPSMLAQSLAADEGVKHSGAFTTPVDADEPGPLHPGDAYEFSFRAMPGDRLSLVTMFVPSNDLFYSPAEKGLALFDGEEPVSGDKTAAIWLWDAGTEENQELGLGPDQVQRQSEPGAGPVENAPVRIVSAVNGSFSYPEDEEVLRLTVTPE